MKKKKTGILWVLFILAIPVLYILLKYFLSDVDNLELIILFAPYLFCIITFMYRIDERFYFRIMYVKQWIFGTYTSWIFSTRYEGIKEHENLLNNIINELTKSGYKTIKKEQDFCSVLWKSRNIFNFRIEKMDNRSSLHFYTSIIDVSFRSMKNKIKEFSTIFEKMENSIIMIDRNDKQYEVEISYNNISPFYSFWIKTLPSESIVFFNCSIRDNDGIVTVNKNKIRYCTQSLQDLFFRIEKYINLRGD
jgi:hypothetical protein